MRPSAFAEAMTDALRRKLAGGKARVPAGGDLLFRWFLDLSEARGWHSGGACPITYADINAYCARMRWPIEPRHVEIILAMDAAYITDFYSKRNSASGRKVFPAAPKGPVTPKLFDTLFG